MSNEVFKYTLAIDADPSSAIGGIKQLQSALNGVRMPADFSADMIKDFDKLKDSLTKFKTLAGKSSFSKKDLKELERLQTEIDSTFSHLTNSMNELNGKTFYLDADYSKIQEAKTEVDKIKSDIENKLNSIKFNIDGSQGGKISLNLGEMINDMERGVKSSKVLSAAMQEVRQSFESGSFSTAGQQLTEIINKAGNLKGASAGLLDTFKKWGIIDFTGPAKSIGDMEERARLLGVAFQKILPLLAQDEAGIKQLAVALGTAVDKQKELEQTGQQRANAYMQERINSVEQLATSTAKATQEERQLAQATSETQNQVKQLQQSTQYFFSLRNMLNLFKRGIKEAVQTVKELDAAMTETAVVTDFSVGDMWEKLPQYTANANALGATVKDMYEATTLYYQQGLGTEAAMGIANETMKMARIGGLEAADATDKMTAALRGFNMELNEASAQRVNDVYSNLAAKTASDTEELGTAMQRTASIAASAGMSFEGTAAFLAQAIETTREPAENLGTAMKTIVARFQELKKNPLEISEVDGEEVDYNKVDTALKSIGVSLTDTNGQFRDLDQVFLEISERWDSLTQTQQRYIATTAAGSRQQSRFIAMMSNYDRTMQLMDYANNSSGASAEQFNKTLESLEAKLNKFQNAWKQFLMGIMNDTWTKRLVDTGTTILNVVNKIIDTLSFGGKAGLLKSALSTFTAFTALKMTGRGANALIGGLGGMLDPKSSIGEGLRQGMMGSRQAASAQQAAMIYQPIVAELRAIRQLQGQQISKENQARLGPYDQYNKFKSARSGLNEFAGSGKSFKLNDVLSQLQGLSASNQNILMRGNAGTASTLTNSILASYVNGTYGSKKRTQDTNILAGLKNGERFLNTQRKAGKIAWEDYFKGVSDPKILKNAIDRTVGDGKYEAAYQYLDTLDKQVSIAASKRTAKSDVMQAFKDRYDSLIAEGLSSKEAGAQLRQENWAGKIREENQRQRGKVLEGKQEDNQNSKGAAFLNSIGKLGSGVSQAGMGLQAFGNLLTSSANPALQVFGTALNSIGGLISGIGMGISGLSAGFTAIAESSVMTSLASSLAGKSLLGLSLTAGTLTGIFAVVAGVVTALVIGIKKHNEKIKKAGEELTKNYTDRKTELDSNINNLESMKAEFNLLSEGVDEFGNNVSLDTSQYNRYKEIIAQIAAINPSIVEGYNAQGEAIINNNQALEETLALQRQLQKENVTKYTSTTSLQALINARNQEDAFKQTGIEGGTKRAAAAATYYRELKKNISVDTLAKWGIDSNKTSFEQLEFLSQNLSSIQSKVEALKLDETEAAKILEKASNFQVEIEAMEQAAQPLYESLSEFATLNNLFTSVPEELRTSYQNGLKQIANSFKSAPEMQDAARSLATKYNKIFKDSRYTESLQEIQKAVDQYSKDLDADAYQSTINNGIVHDNITAMIDELKDSTDEADIAARNYLQGFLSKSGNIKQVVDTINNAFDTMSKHIDKVKEAAEAFNESVDSLDPYSGAKNLKSIYDTVYDENSTHAKLHDAVYWKGVENFIDPKLFKSGDTSAIDNLMSEIAPTLEEGMDGVIATRDFLLKHEDGVFFKNDNGKLVVDIDNDEELAAAAEKYNLKPEVLAAMLKRLPGIDFSDYDAIRSIYSADAHLTENRALKGKDDQLGLLITENKALADALAAGKSPEEFYQEGGTKDKLKEKGIDLLPDFEKNNKENNAQIGKLLDKYDINADNYIKKLNTLGVERDQIKEIGENLIEGVNIKNFDDDYARALAEIDDPNGVATVDRLGDIIGVLQQIAGHLGINTDETGISIGRANQEDFLSDDFQSILTDPNGQVQNFLNGNKADGKPFQTKTEIQEAKDYITKDLVNGLKVYQKEVEAGKKAAEEYAEQHPLNQAAQTKVQEYDNELKKIQANSELLQQIINSNPMLNGFSNLNGLNGFNESYTSPAFPSPGGYHINQEALRYNLLKFLGFDKPAVGNTDLYNRPVIDWGEDPTKNSNYKAAKTWGYTSEDLKNTKSTYMSSAMTFGEGDNTFTLTYTPVLPDGTILDRDTTEKYVNDLVSQSTNPETGEVDYTKLFNLDKIGTDGINSLFMGAFSGEDGGIDLSNAFADVTHIMSDLVTQGYGEAISNLDPAQIAQDSNAYEALKNVYNDILQGTVPAPEDLQALNLNSLDSTTKATQSIGERLRNLWDTFVQTDKAALAMDVVPTGDNVDKAIQNIGTRLKNWWDKINGIEPEGTGKSKTNVPQPSPSVSTPTPAPQFSVDTSPGITAVDELQSKIDNAKSSIEGGATFSVNVTGAKKLTDASKAADSLTSKNGKSAAIAVSTGSVDKESVKKGIAEINKSKAAIKVDANTQAAQQKARHLANTIDSYHATIDISANFTGSWSKTVTVTESPGHKATGALNHGYAPAPPQAGSAARGSYGQVGPKGKGGLTLTGELGYEIAWLPDENRSMILGANGPQMVNLPGNAVVWTHEQSKKIMKQKAIPAGSHAAHGTVDLPTGNNNAGGRSSSNGKGKPKKTSTEKALEKVLEKGGKVSVWWENIARIAEATQRKADKNQKTFEKALKTFGKSASSVSQIGETYKKNLQALQAVYKKEKTQAEKELKNLDKKGKTSISYEVTKVNKKGKKKKETKKEDVNLGKYIKYDKTLETYVIDNKAISAVASKNKSKAKAIKDAAEQKLNDKLSKRNTAEDKIRDAQEALDKIADDIYTTFYQWENSLNKIYLLSQRLNDLNNQMTYQGSREELLSAKALAGFNSEGDGAELRKILEEERGLMIQQVDTNRQNVNATREAYENSLKLSTYTARYKNQPNSAEAKADLKAAQWALKFIKAGGTFNENTVASLEAKGFSQDTIERIKKILEDINSKREAAINASNDTLGAVIAMYNKMEEYQSYIADFENELVSGLEEQAEQQINKLDKLNSSLSKALKDLLDQVKKGLDDRRKAEDNAKTESEISQKRQRLAMLQADTSGGHAVEIAQLQKEISDSQRDYQRSLEDQLIEKLQDQGDKAERQRQLQIDLLTANKDIAKQTGTNLAQVKEWLEHPTENYDKIRSAWLANKGYEDMTVNEQEQTEQEFNEAWMKYTGYSDELQKLETTNGHLTSIYEEVKGIAEAVINNKAPGNTSWKGLRDAKISASQARGLGATASQLLEAGYDKGEVFKAGYSKKELSDAKITLKNLMEYKNITDADLRKRGYDMASVMTARGYKKNVTNYKKMAKAGYKAADFKKAKISAADALKAGLKKEDVAKAYGLSAMTSTNAISGKDVQSATGASAGTIQKFVSKNIKDREVSQSDMSGVTAKMDINGSKKGGSQTGTIGTSGKKIASNKGSTLYVQEWDTTKGKAVGKAKSYPIDKLTSDLIKAYPKEAKEALISAIKNKKVGKKINKNMKSLVSAAGIAGKTYKLSNGIVGSVGGNGKIYYNSGKKGVQIWNAASGKLTLDKYNKNDFIKKAKKKAAYSREYEQVLKANGVKKYATGGLATQTGPAWLDGTPSKPELVLNAQDTKNFMALKDVLSHAVGTTNQVENSYGGNATYEININVDHLNNDYDVDRVVERVKKKIVQDSGYRNVTQVRKFR